MPTINVDIVSAEGEIYSGEAAMVFAPAKMGEVGIAPRHAPLLTALKPGEVRVQDTEGKLQTSTTRFLSHSSRPIPKRPTYLQGSMGKGSVPSKFVASAIFLWDHHDPVTGEDTPDIYYQIFIPFVKANSKEADLFAGKYGQRFSAQQIC